MDTIVSVIVDHFSKRYISLPLLQNHWSRGHGQIVYQASLSMEGPPDTIVSDSGGQFTSDFWRRMCNILGVKLKLSAADHPQNDGQIGNANQIIEQRLRPFVSHYQNGLVRKLPMMDFAGALLIGESTETSPFLIDSGYTPRTSFDWKSNPNGTVIEFTSQQQLQK